MASGIHIYSITKREFDRRVQSAVESGAYRTSHALKKAQYEFHQEEIMNLFEEGLANASSDHELVSTTEPIYVVVVRDESESLATLSERFSNVDRSIVHGLLMYNLSTAVISIIHRVLLSHESAAVQELHYYNDNDASLEDYYPRQLPLVKRIGFYGYAYVYAYPFLYRLGDYYNADRCIEYITIDMMKLKVNYRYGSYVAIGSISRSLPIKVIDIDRHYPWRLNYTSKYAPETIEWLTIPCRTYNVAPTAEDNPNLHTLYVFELNVRWRNTTGVGKIENLIELYLHSYSDAKTMVPLTRYPNLEILRMQLTSYMPFIAPKTIARLRHLKVLHIYGNRDITYPDIFDTLKAPLEELKINSRIPPSVASSKTIRLVIVYNPSVRDLDDVARLEKAGISIMFENNLKLDRDDVDRDTVVSAMVKYMDHDMLLTELSSMLASLSIK